MKNKFKNKSLVSLKKKLNSSLYVFNINKVYIVLETKKGIVEIEDPITKMREMVYEDQLINLY